MEVNFTLRPLYLQIIYESLTARDQFWDILSQDSFSAFP
jgi:hypothetical protein